MNITFENVYKSLKDKQNELNEQLDSIIDSQNESVMKSEFAAHQLLGNMTTFMSLSSSKIAFLPSSFEIQIVKLNSQ